MDKQQDRMAHQGLTPTKMTMMPTPPGNRTARRAAARAARLQVKREAKKRTTAAVKESDAI